MTGVFGRDVRRYAGPGVAAARAISRSVLTASHGYSTVQLGIAHMAARSSRAIWDGPSSPIETPAWDPANLTFSPEIPVIRAKSLARERKQANVEGNGIAPR